MHALLQINIDDLFNTREMAYICWGILGFIGFISVKSLRKDFYPVLQSLFSRYFIPIYLLTIAYISLCSFLLSRLNFWDKGLIKDTVSWGIFAALPMMFRIIQSKNLSKYFADIVKELFKVTILLEFIMGLYTFNFLVELLIVPVMVFLAALIVFSGREEKNQKVTRVLNGLSSAIGIFLGVIVISHIIKNFGKYWNLEYLKQFFLPISLSLMFVPFLYLLVCYARFQEVFVVLNIKLKSKPLLGYTKMKILFNFYNNMEGLKRWQMLFARLHPRNKLEVSNSIVQIQQTQKREADPPMVNLDSGWSPYVVKDLLVEKDIVLGFYEYQYPGDWGVTSKFVELDSNLWGVKFTYGVYGNELAVTSIKLRLDIIDAQLVGETEFIYLAYIDVVYRKLFNVELPIDIYTAVLLHETRSFKFSNYQIVLDKSYFNNNMDGYRLKFSILHGQHKEV